MARMKPKKNVFGRKKDKKPKDVDPAAPPEKPEESADIVEDFTVPREKRFVKFEEYFPPLKLTEAQEQGITTWLKQDLLKCKRFNDTMRNRWALFRAIYSLSYVAKFYPSMGLSASFASGILTEKTLEAMDRLSRSIFGPRPLFIEDDKQSGVSGEKIEQIHKGEWLLHRTLVQELKIEEEIDPRGLFEFILDGSYILEADILYERVPERTLRTYVSADQLAEDSARVLDKGALDQAFFNLGQGLGPQTLLVEADVLTKDGMRVFYVNKVDHLIPKNVYSDKDLKFRGRRMYYTKDDLMLLASPGVDVYSMDKVEKVIAARAADRAARKSGDKDSASEVVSDSEKELFYDWAKAEGDNLKTDQSTVPYKETFSIYRVTCKYPYKTKGDPQGKIPKWVVFDYSPEGNVILRSVTYPHFHERPNWFHFKLGYMPKSYYGFGFGDRLFHDDQLASNIINIYMDSAALSTYTPFLAKHPEAGGRIPFRDGLGPMKVGYVDNIEDFKQLDIKPPPVALIQNLYPLLLKGAEDKTSITSLTQGRTESSDPRSPARKTEMLLGEAAIGIETMIRHWNRTGWEPLADYTWSGLYEQTIYRGETELKIESGLPALGIHEPVTIPLDELQRPIVWKSQAASDFINTEERKNKFIEQFSFFAPLITQMIQINPDMFKYLMRWLWYSGEVLDVRGARFLLPSLEELQAMGPQAAGGMLTAMADQIKAGNSPGTLNLQNTGIPDLEENANAGPFEQQP